MYNYNSILQFINKIEYNNLLFEYRKKDKEEDKTGKKIRKEIGRKIYDRWNK